MTTLKLELELTIREYFSDLVISTSDDKLVYDTRKYLNKNFVLTVIQSTRCHCKHLLYHERITRRASGTSIFIVLC